MNLLDTPVRVNEEGERLYFNIPGEVCVDLTSGKAEDRKAVLEFLAQAQEMARLHVLNARVPCGFAPQCPDSGTVRRTWCVECQSRAVLRDAGVIP